MKNSIIIFILLFVTSNLISQEYWSKTFEVYPGNEQVWQMNVLGDTILMAAVTTCDDFSPCTFLVSLNKEGEISQVQNFDSPGGMFFPSGYPGLRKFEDEYTFNVLTDKYSTLPLGYLIYIDPKTLDINGKIQLSPKIKSKRNTGGHQILSIGKILDFG